MNKKLPVHEMFHAFQGEGVHMGRSAFFIRLFGCPLHCSFCDSAGTWHPDYAPKPVKRLQVSEIVDAIRSLPVEPQMIVVTGGEPGAFDLWDLTNTITEQGLRPIPIHVETSGAFPLKGNFDWITVSPKRGDHPALASCLDLANELKFIIETPEDIQYWCHFIQPALDRREATMDAPNLTIWLHPEWSKRNDPVVLNAISKAVLELPNHLNVRAGYQIHKLYKCDSLDPRSAIPAPLGGDIAKGY